MRVCFFVAVMEITLKIIEDFQAVSCLWHVRSIQIDIKREMLWSISSKNTRYQIMKRRRKFLKPKPCSSLNLSKRFTATLIPPENRVLLQYRFLDRRFFLFNYIKSFKAQTKSTKSNFSRHHVLIYGARLARDNVSATVPVQSRVTLSSGVY